MYLRTSTTKSTGNSCAQIEQLKQALAAADTLIIGAGAGLSASAGFEYGGNRFQQYFSDFEARYGFHDMYSGGFFPYDTLEAYWAFWSRNIYVNRYLAPPRPVYEDLLRLVREKDYFVITTNVDHCFQRSGFDRKRLFYTQGDYGLWQCSKPCCQRTYDNEAAVRTMLARQKDMKIPSELVPRCPVCGAPMSMNLRADGTFVEDEGWHAAAKRYERFLQANSNRPILFLELGVGYNTPVIIKYPFWKMTAQNKHAIYACINNGQAACPQEIAAQSICINGDIGCVLRQLL
ncbi:Sir2 silent information regulator family NAD-dependent deacetylase [uncultured Pseudoflavonifractor sp.]|uniref:SIR2 family NAD-dependent protein deacylase n=1 Tax=uncultured Pseudoflavonifractor sp. TaxID=1221379 RepID=UPI0025DAA2CA|nr:Sir2 silent information regulator family NAD-dependent deacetylase [uncultured Pseudoflavonifractor sp.]